jgi:hypothetical protein
VVGVVAEDTEGEDVTVGKGNEANGGIAEDICDVEEGDGTTWGTY